NHLLRDRLLEEVKNQLPDAKLFLPHPSLTGDNALMIVIAAALDGKKKAPNTIGAEANLRLGS
ncbi:MAG: tRNA (adenosine(37)-N6)-threonylcarbamoyltransferase complex transferase subunit TsaD, partial [Patescibacteria group bacterium]